MERLKRGLAFWVMLFVACAFSASSAQTQQKKRLYKAQVKIDVSGVGNSLLQPTISGYDLDANTNPHATDLGLVVTKVDLSIGDSREIVLCQNGNPDYGDCPYNSEGYLELVTSINNTSFIIAGITGGEFRAALDAGNVIMQFNDGAGGSGNYIRIF